MKRSPSTRPADTFSPPGGERHGGRAGIHFYALVFGLFLGLAIWKFGNPVILDHKIFTPSTPTEFWVDSWPTHWANWIFLPLALIGALLAYQRNFRRGERPHEPAGGGTRSTQWLWRLPLLWFGWQVVSATRTVDADLTTATLWQFFGCVACYFIGALVIGTPVSDPARWSSSFGMSGSRLTRELPPDSPAGSETGVPRALSFLLIGVLAAFAFGIVRAVDQRLVEFPQSHQMLVDGERTGWTNIPPEMLSEMKQEQIVITTNGLDVANPVFLKKFASGRVMGTLVYPNALAGAVLLLWPLALTLAFGAKQLRPALRNLVIALACLLGGAGFFWTGSKLGWLMGMAVGGLYLFRLKWPVKMKIAALALVAVAGLGVFAVRFHHYFEKGATSVVARFDYWRAAVQTTETHPVTGTGPGTFQHPYAQIKSPEAEMARMAHNDYLEQFSDSGIPGGVFYAAWIVIALTTLGRRVWRTSNQIQFAIFVGLLGWFAQGLGEFSLFIPALAWTAFTLLGCSLALTGNRLDKSPGAR